MAVGDADERLAEENLEEMKEESVENDEPEEDQDGDEDQDGGDEAGEESGGDDEVEEEDEEDPVDPLDEIREKCVESSACAKLKEVFDTCNERVNSRSNTEETCAQELLDFVHCQDACVAKVLFSKLK